jgi:hypothetical protein
MANPTLSDLVGGIQSVTLGDEEARRRGTQKSILERKAPPTFQAVVEIQNWDRVAIHHNVADTVDSILRGYRISPEVREIGEDGDVRRVPPAELRAGEENEAAERGRGYSPPWEGPAISPRSAGAPVSLARRRREQKAQPVYPYGISRKRMSQAIKETGSTATVADRLEESDVVVTDRSYYRRRPQSLREAESRGIPIFVLKNNTLLQMEQALLSLSEVTGGDPVFTAMNEAEEAIATVISQERPVELTPQRAYIRRLQHELAQRYNLTSRSMGREPERRVRILPGQGQPNGVFGEIED